jgi:7-carboxy-7-deazaguanine synthase
MKVTEVYSTVQGEGPFVGTPIVVLRTGVCNLQCSWCDTKYSWRKEYLSRLKNIDTDEKLDELLDTILHLANEKNINTILLTGGEPMIWQKDHYFVQLIHELVHNMNFNIHVETNGTVPLILGSEFKFISISPKVGEYFRFYKNEAMQTYLKHPNKIFKFVVGTKDDVVQITSFVDKFNLHNERIWLMPRGTNLSEMSDSIRIINDCKAQLKTYDINFEVSERRHIILGVR